jgi:hypothetical protein
VSVVLVVQDNPCVCDRSDRSGTTYRMLPCKISVYLLSMNYHGVNEHGMSTVYAHKYSGSAGTVQ